MGCYHNTLEFLELIGGSKLLYKQDQLELLLIEEGGREFKLAASGKYYPWNLILGFLKFDAISLKEKLGLINIITELIFYRRKNQFETVAEFLKRNKQGENISKFLWDFLVVGALNTNSSSASASLFKFILSEIFLKGNSGSTIIIPEVPLSRLYCDLSADYILKSGGKISLSERVREFEIKNGKVTGITTGKNTYTGFNYIVSAIPLESLKDILPPSETSLDLDLHYSPIISAHLWFHQNPFNEKFYGLVGSEVHWLFNHSDHISLVKSDAGSMINRTNAEILVIFLEELEKYFPFFKREMVLESRIIKEKKATFIPSVDSEIQREGLVSSYNNLLLAGDWTNTGLPSTIEGAVKSGKKAAEKIETEI